MAEFTEAQVTEALEKIVADAGEGFVYKGGERDEYGYFPGDCMYFEDGAPSCLVGHLIDALGMPKDLIPEGQPVSSYSGTLNLEEHFDPTVVRGLIRAQQSQDAGETWGYALARYKEVL